MCQDVGLDCFHGYWLPDDLAPFAETSSLVSNGFVLSATMKGVVNSIHGLVSNGFVLSATMKGVVNSIHALPTETFTLAVDPGVEIDPQNLCNGNLGLFAVLILEHATKVKIWHPVA